MVDIQVKPYHDLTSAKVQQHLLNKIASGRKGRDQSGPMQSQGVSVGWHGPRENGPIGETP